MNQLYNNPKLENFASHWWLAITTQAIDTTGVYISGETNNENDIVNDYRKFKNIRITKIYLDLSHFFELQISLCTGYVQSGASDRSLGFEDEIWGAPPAGGPLL